jgi:hypothetical protein
VILGLERDLRYRWIGGFAHLDFWITFRSQIEGKIEWKLRK